MKGKTMTNNELVGAHEMLINGISVRDMDTEQLKLELARGLEITVRHLQSLALIWRELEYRGEDMSGLRHGLMNYLPLIAFNKVDARLIVKYAGQKTLLSQLTRLPVELQARIVENDCVKVIYDDGEGGFREELKSVADLRLSEIYQVFTDDGVRNEDQQKRMLITRGGSTKISPIAAPRKARMVKIDKKNKALLVGTASVEINRVMQQLSEYYGVDLLAVVKERA
jgi:hypothetical protein